MLPGTRASTRVAIRRPYKYGSVIYFFRQKAPGLREAVRTEFLSHALANCVNQYLLFSGHIGKVFIANRLTEFNANFLIIHAMRDFADFFRQTKQGAHIGRHRNCLKIFFYRD